MLILGGQPLVLENRNVAKPDVSLEIQDAITIKGNAFFHLGGRKFGQRYSMSRSLNHDLVRAHRVHAIEHAHGPPVFATLDEKDRGAIVKHSGAPRAIGVSQLLNRLGREMLISRTKGAKGFRIVEIRQHPPSSGHHPSVSDRVESKFSHGLGLSVEFLPQSQKQR
jgi:hypothetical protein